MIEWVEMVNWRAYDQRRVEFKTGVTFLMGPNGAGKTSILEAVAYALTGQPSTVKDRCQLLRDPNKLAVVRLGFSMNGSRYEVERSQSCKKAEMARLVRLGDGKRLATTHASVTKQIEELMGVSADFLQRIVYMAEGDVFRFLDEPPAKALDLQIRQVLGLTQLDHFVEALDKAEKEIKARIAQTQALLDELDRLGLREAAEIEKRLHQIDGQRKELSTELRELENAQTRWKRETDDLLRLRNIAMEALPTLQTKPTTWAGLKNESVLRLFSRLEQEMDRAQASHQDLQASRARLDGEKRGYQRVLDILAPLAERDGTVPCPVCAKPMTPVERRAVIDDLHRSIQRILAEAETIEDTLRRTSDESSFLREQWEALREMRNVLTHVRFESLSPEATLADIQRLFDQQVTVETHQDEERRIRIAEIGSRQQTLDGEKAEFIAISRRLESSGFESPEDVAEELVQLETRSLSLRAASAASQETLAHQRNSDIQAIYGQIARVWEAFSNQDRSLRNERHDQNWHVELDKKGAVRVEDPSGRQFDLSQFSGGEKTAMMVMLHTIIAHHFSKTDFLLVDEPLEHLDAVNRRSLIKFLISAHRRGIFKQAIVATFEESLLRKYMSAEGVQVVYI